MVVIMILPRFFFADEFTDFYDTIISYGGKAKRFAKGSILWDANNEKHTSYFIKSGIAKHIVANEEGNEAITFFLSNGSMFPFNCLNETFTLEPFMHLVAHTDLEVLALKQPDLIRLIHDNGDFACEIVNHFDRFTNMLISRNLLSSYNDSCLVICTFLYLLYHYNPTQDGVIINLTQEELHRMMGISRTTLTRIIKTLRDGGIIQTSREHIKIINMDKLKDMCSDLID